MKKRKSRLALMVMVMVMVVGATESKLKVPTIIREGLYMSTLFN